MTEPADRFFRTVKELMLSLDEYATIDADATLQEALVALSKSQLGLTDDRHQHRAILVLGRDGRVVGKLTHWAVLRGLQPTFFNENNHKALSRAGLSSEFIESLEQRCGFLPNRLASMCKDAARMRVKDAMVPVRESIDEDAPLTHAIRMIVVGHSQSLLVTRAGDVVGILRLADVFELIADMIREGEA